MIERPDSIVDVPVWNSLAANTVFGNDATYDRRNLRDTAILTFVWKVVYLARRVIFRSRN